MCAPGAPSSPPPFPSTLPPSLPLRRRQIELQTPPPCFVPPHPPPPLSLSGRLRPHLRHHQLTAHLVRTSSSSKLHRSSVAVYDRRHHRFSSSPPAFPTRRVVKNVSTVFTVSRPCHRYPRRRPPLSQTPMTFGPSAPPLVLTWPSHVAPPQRPRQPYTDVSRPVSQSKPSQRRRILKRIFN